MKKVQRTLKRIIHVIAHCNDCDFREDLFTTAAREAIKHCRKTGHRVSVEIGINYQVYSKD